jgi:hypothetical protein
MEALPPVCCTRPIGRCWWFDREDSMMQHVDILSHLKEGFELEWGSWRNRLMIDFVLLSLTHFNERPPFRAGV